MFSCCCVCLVAHNQCVDNTAYCILKTACCRNGHQCDVFSAGSGEDHAMSALFTVRGLNACRDSLSDGDAACDQLCPVTDDRIDRVLEDCCIEVYTYAVGTNCNTACYDHNVGLQIRDYADAVACGDLEVIRLCSALILSLNLVDSGKSTDFAVAYDDRDQSGRAVVEGSCCRSEYQEYLLISCGLDQYISLCCCDLCSVRDLNQYTASQYVHYYGSSDCCSVSYGDRCVDLIQSRVGICCDGHIAGRCCLDLAKYDLCLCIVNQYADNTRCSFLAVGCRRACEHADQTLCCICLERHILAGCECDSVSDCNVCFTVADSDIQCTCTCDTAHCQCDACRNKDCIIVLGGQDVQIAVRLDGCGIFYFCICLGQKHNCAKVCSDGCFTAASCCCTCHRDIQDICLGGCGLMIVTTGLDVCSVSDFAAYLIFIIEEAQYGTDAQVRIGYGQAACDYSHIGLAGSIVLHLARQVDLYGIAYG